MRGFVRSVLYAIGPAIVFVASGAASPMNGKLLALVPPGCAIVAGFENGHGPHAGGRLLLTTSNNRFDLDDWLGLAGVDTERRYDEVIEVAAWNAKGELNEHLLLVAGRFDRERIFRAARQNGALTSPDAGETVLVIRPFQREQRQMPDARWLAILDNRTALLGTPMLVQEALQRYAAHADADPALIQQLKLLRHDISSWNVLASRQSSSRNASLAKPHSAWERLLEDADVLIVGAHFGPGVRVDFAVHAGEDREASYFNQKAALFSDIFTEETVRQGGLSQAPQPRLENLSVEPRRVQGSIVLSDKQFEGWLAHFGRTQAPSEPERSTTIAETR
jgi:hypothetical protein